MLPSRIQAFSLTSPYGHFAVKTLRRTDASPWDFLPYGSFAVNYVKLSIIGKHIDTSQRYGTSVGLPILIYDFTQCIIWVQWKSVQAWKTWFSVDSQLFVCLQFCMPSQVFSEVIFKKLSSDESCSGIFMLQSSRGESVFLKIKIWVGVSTSQLGDRSFPRRSYPCRSYPCRSFPRQFFSVRSFPGRSFQR